MTKNIMKEIIIILLLTLAIILVLGVLLYEYVPANKIIPEKVAYTTPEEVKKELETVVSSDDEPLEGHEALADSMKDLALDLAGAILVIGYECSKKEITQYYVSKRD